jgi:hypothetical protein
MRRGDAKRGSVAWRSLVHNVGFNRRSRRIIPRRHAPHDAVCWRNMKMRAMWRLGALTMITASCAGAGDEALEVDVDASFEVSEVEAGVSDEALEVDVAAPDEAVGIDSSALTEASGPHNCHGDVSSRIPPSGSYFLTTFGGPGDEQPMACGGHTTRGTPYYAAGSQRYHCHTYLKVQARGKCVIVEVKDRGPDVCVERAAGGAVLDVGPKVARHLFGTSSAGWSDHFLVRVTKVPRSKPLGPC